MPALREERLVGYRLGDIAVPEEIKAPILEQRTCKFDGCNTILSKYNRDKFCGVHYGTKIPKAPKTVLIACIKCGKERYIKYESPSKLEKAKKKPCRSCSNRIRHNSL